jgi:hypothetical protein
MLIAFRAMRTISVVREPGQILAISLFQTKIYARYPMENSRPGFHLQWGILQEHLESERTGSRRAAKDICQYNFASQRSKKRLDSAISRE